MAFLLPKTPVDVYVEDTLVMRRVAERFEFITPELKDGSHIYHITIVDSNDSSIGKDFNIEGVTAGKIVAVDLRAIQQKVH